MLYYKYEKAREGTFGMARKIGFSKVPWLGVLAGLLGYFFHATMPSGGSAIPLIAFSVLMALLFWLSAATLEKRARYDEVFHPMRADATSESARRDCARRGLRAALFLRRYGGEADLHAGGSRRTGASGKRRAAAETGCTACHAVCSGDFVLRVHALFRLPPLDARSGNSGLLLLSVRADLLHDRNLSRGKLLV